MTRPVTAPRSCLPLPEDLPPRVLSRADLAGAGLRGRAITAAVRGGVLLRPRNGHYLPAPAAACLAEAVRCGGRLDCVSLLSQLGVFVQDSRDLHLQLDPDASRVPEPHAGTVRHWRPTRADRDATLAPLEEAIVQAVLCQSPRAAVATLDSAWHLGLIGESEVAEIFSMLPRRYRRLRPLLDPRAGSGIETLVRLMLRGLSCRVELQVRIADVGYVDLLVDGWLIVECDSVRHHGDWQAHKVDRRRDAAAVAQGFTTLRVLAEDVLFRPEWTLEILRGALRTRVQNSGAAAPRRPRRRPEESLRAALPEF